MALEGEERSYIVGLVVGMLGTAPSSALMAELTAVYTGSRSLSDLADHIAASDVYISKHSRGQTVKEVAADILDSAIVGGILTGDLRTSVIDLIAGGLTAGTYTIASASKAVVDYLSNTANNDNADLGDIAKAFQNRKEVAEAYTVKITLAGIDSTPAELAAVIEGVTSDAATLTAAAEAVDDAAAEAAAVAAAEAAAAAAAAATAAQKAVDDAAAEAAAVAAAEAAAAAAAATAAQKAVDDAAAEAAAVAAAEAAAAAAAAAAAQKAVDDAAAEAAAVAAAATAAQKAVDDAAEAAAVAAVVAAAEAAAVAAAEAAAAAQKAVDDAAAAAVTGRQSLSLTVDIGSPAGGLGDDIIFAPQSVATNETLFGVGDQNSAATDMREWLTVDGSINIVLSTDTGATGATAGPTVVSDIAIKLVGTLDINA